MWAVSPDHIMFKSEFTRIEGTKTGWRHGLYDPAIYYENVNVFPTESGAIQYILSHYRDTANTAGRKVRELEARLAEL